MEKISTEKDLGINVDEDLSYKPHIHKAVNKANSTDGLIRRSFIYIDREIFTFLLKALVQPHLGCAASF